MAQRSIASVFTIFVLTFSYGYAQTFQDKYEQFRQSAHEKHSSFRKECNRKYAEFMRQSWSWFEGKEPLSLPKEEPVPPRPYMPKDDKNKEVEVLPIAIEPVMPTPQPKPVEPIPEVPRPSDMLFEFEFYGVPCKVRMPEATIFKIKGLTVDVLADEWERLSDEGMNNTIRDCLETRIRYNLSDWAYLGLLNELSSGFCPDENGATLLMAYLFCQSGYQMRLGMDKDRLVMLYGTKHYIYDKPYYMIKGRAFYPYGNISGSLRICEAVFEGETPMSLVINGEQKLGESLSEIRSITSKRYDNMSVPARVPTALIIFYDSYPTSAIDNNPLTRWAMYANTPLAEKTKDTLYPYLRESIKDCSVLESADRLLNWVQTGFVYEYDDKVWGCDRAFFAEETLYYPFCDCEDRSILFSRLVRDLLGLDVALLYYPGHLATAVKFDSDVRGATMIIDGERYIVCDPTYIGAPVGSQMPGLEYDKAQAIILSR